MGRETGQRQGKGTEKKRKRFMSRSWMYRELRWLEKEERREEEEKDDDDEDEDEDDDDEEQAAAAAEEEEVEKEQGQDNGTSNRSEYL
ncbi:hypothetical protein BGAL_0047g00450 [Botrytis galanthina]|uniref:Uncharacterized protein n=1 Tax=Botrytis galanthina TaxID=278940 RepID=A0A4S8R8M6_9HELO|nr:hypothetical protein BGAL_0047g00450 [Botrytis galanthina]